MVPVKTQGRCKQCLREACSVSRIRALRNGGFSAEFSVEEHDASGVNERQFYLTDTFQSQELAIAAATQAGRQKIDLVFERGRAVVNG
jgi:hypothetical protein